MQQRSVKEYEQQVLAVLNDFNVLDAANDAKIAVIGAEAQRKAQIIINSARTQALIVEQTAKANATAKVAKALGFSNAETLGYMKVKAIRQHPSNGTVVGLGEMFKDEAAV